MDVSILDGGEFCWCGPPSHKSLFSLCSSERHPSSRAAAGLSVRPRCPMGAVVGQPFPFSGGVASSPYQPFFVLCNYMLAMALPCPLTQAGHCRPVTSQNPAFQARFPFKDPQWLPIVFIQNHSSSVQPFVKLTLGTGIWCRA